MRRLTESRATVAANLSASLMLAEAEVVTLRARLAAVEAWPLTLEQVHAIVDYLLGVGSRAGLIHGDTLNRAMGASARRRAALAVTTGEGECIPWTTCPNGCDGKHPTTGEGEHVAREVFTYYQSRSAAAGPSADPPDAAPSPNR